MLSYKVSQGRGKGFIGQAPTLRELLELQRGVIEIRLDERTMLMTLILEVRLSPSQYFTPIVG